MTNCTHAENEEGGDALTALLFVMICFIALSVGCTMTIEALKEVWRHMVKKERAADHLGSATCASSGRACGGSGQRRLASAQPTVRPPSHCHGW